MKKYIILRYKIIVLIVFTMMQLCIFNTIISFSAESIKGMQTIEDGIYVIRSAIDQKFVLDVLRSIKR